MCILHTVGSALYEGVIFGCKVSYCITTQIITLKSLINCSDSGMLYSFFIYGMSPFLLYVSSTTLVTEHVGRCKLSV